jgi:hypothetical protein
MRFDHGYMECYWLDKVGFHAVAHKVDDDLDIALLEPCSDYEFYLFLNKNKESICSL